MGTRRGRGEGSLFQRADGQWCAILNNGYDADGKRARRTVYGRTKQEAREKLTRLQVSLLGGLATDATRQSIAQFLKHWLEVAVRPSRRETTYLRYADLVRLHINPIVGGIALSKADPRVIQGLYSELANRGASPRTRQLVHAVLHRAFGQAVKWGQLPQNVCDAVEKPRVPKRAMTVWSPNETSRFLEAARSDRLYALYVLALLTALRQGELLGLQWQDIDLKTGALAVRFTLVEIKGALSLSEPKTSKGKRRVDLPRLATVALREHRERMMAEGHIGGYVFCDSQGGPLRKSNVVRRSFRPLMQRAAVLLIRFHDLRHTAATLLLQQGVHPKVVQERLGHAQIGVTLDTYSHVLPSMQAAAAQRLDTMFEEMGTEFGYKLATENAQAPILPIEATHNLLELNQKNGAPGTIRTCDLRIRSPVLYPG